jgi:ubiquitin C-terminal hydrolase
LNEFEEHVEYNKEAADAFAPEYIYDALLTARKNIDSIKGRQEDAQEFFGYLIDSLHEELLSKENGLATDASMTSSADDTWFEIGKKNKAHVTRRTEIKESAMSRMFGGRMRSIVKCPGAKDSITLEPFQAIQLDITVSLVLY